MRFDVNEHSPEWIKEQLWDLNRTQIYLSKVFRRTPQQINAAIKGKQYPTLKEKIIKHILLLKAKGDKNG